MKLYIIGSPTQINLQLTSSHRKNIYVMLVSLGCLRVLIEGVKLISDAIFKNSIYPRGKFVVLNPPAEKIFQKGRSCFVPNFINHCRH